MGIITLVQMELRIISRIKRQEVTFTFIFRHIKIFLLYIEENQIGPDGAKEISNILRELKALTTLDIS